MDYDISPSSSKAFIASTIAGVISTTITAPLWTLKTRLNLHILHHTESSQYNVKCKMIVGSKIDWNSIRGYVYE